MEARSCSGAFRSAENTKSRCVFLSEVSYKSNSTPYLSKFRGKTSDLFHTRQHLCIQRGQRAVRWAKKRRVTLDILSSNRTGWGHWVGLLRRGSLFALFFFFSFPPSSCDQPVSLCDPLRMGIGSCCSSKSTLNWWEEVAQAWKGGYWGRCHLVLSILLLFNVSKWARTILLVLYQEGRGVKAALQSRR